jgi:hypothetical protein
MPQSSFEHVIDILDYSIDVEPADNQHILPSIIYSIRKLFRASYENDGCEHV